MKSVFQILEEAIHTRTDEADQRTHYGIKCKPLFAWESWSKEDQEMMTDSEHITTYILNSIYRKAGHCYRTKVGDEQYICFEYDRYPKAQILLALERVKASIQNSFTVAGDRVEFPPLSTTPEQLPILSIVESVIGKKPASGLPTSETRTKGEEHICSIKMSDAKRIAPILGLDLSKGHKVG